MAMRDLTAIKSAQSQQSSVRTRSLPFMHLRELSNFHNKTNMINTLKKLRAMGQLVVLTVVGRLNVAGLMYRSGSVIFRIALVACTFICISGIKAPAQQAFNQTYASAYAKAHKACTKLFSNPVFDPFRSKIPLGDEKPTFSMLKNTEKLRPKDRPIADLAMAALEQCRKAYAPVYAMLPSNANAVIEGVQKEQDAVIAELYRGKITFGDYNIAMDKMVGQLAAVLSGIAIRSETEPRLANKSLSPPLNLSPPRRVISSFNGSRLALVIGNSDYSKLPKLANPAKDARSIAKVLEAMGYKTRLLLNVSQEALRNGVRKFANDSERADVSIVYYAGHGAQLKGSNYLLPVDIDIPRTNADIALSALKVDDLVNSIASDTKIIFLDACRNNPVLFKNLVRGRGSPPAGLAPAAASNFSEPRPGGGIFIAYATDTGTVADDGSGDHSPFTQALLRYIQKPISIDDMFSMVTKEVRLVTKNAQRPYKYASLENIICVAPNCSNSTAPIVQDVVRQAKKSETEDLNVALQTKNLNALETYLKDYPETPRKNEIYKQIQRLKRTEFTEWTLYEIGNKHIPYYFQTSAIRDLGNRVAAKFRYQVDPKVPKVAFGKTFPDAEYGEDVDVFDCQNSKYTIANETIYGKSEKILFHYNFGDPRYLPVTLSITPGTVLATARDIMCRESARTPSVSKEQLAKTKFKMLSSTVAGDGDLFYESLSDDADTQGNKHLLFILKYHNDRKIPLVPGTTIPHVPTYQTEVDRTELNCKERKLRSMKTEYYNASHNLVYVLAYEYSAKVANWLDIKSITSPLSLLHRIFCGEEFGGIGVQISVENTLAKVLKVFKESPAAVAGINVGDVISEIDGQSVEGFSVNKIIQKMRGPANSKVKLTIKRNGEEATRQFSITREIIHANPIAEQARK